MMNSGLNQSYKWYFITGALAASYTTLAYLLIKGNSYLSRTDLWSSWHEELALDQLLAIPQSQLGQDLLLELHRRYLNLDGLDEKRSMLPQFLTDIKEEEATLKWYDQFFGWLTYLKLVHIFPFGKNRFSSLKERLQRLAYYKNIFQSWVVQTQMPKHHILTDTLSKYDAPEIS